MIRERIQSPQLEDPVVTQNRSGIQVLLGVRKERCECCGYGTRIDTVWATHQGEAQRISWCQSCFNAECAEVDLDSREQRACREMVGSLALRPPARTWPCARPAIEDLEARGLV